MNIVKELVDNPIYMLLASNILLLIALITRITVLRKTKQNHETKS